MSPGDPLRLAVDVGGTFTDLIVERADQERPFELFKSPTTPDDPIVGVLNTVETAATALGLDTRGLLAQSSMFIHATTRATNAIINRDVARTALLTTEGHPDILLWREGTRIGTFDFSEGYPDRYIPRQLTFEIPERMDVHGRVVKALDEDAVVGTIRELERHGVQAVAVAFLWSVVNGAHEARVGELLRRYLPGVPFTLSHELTSTVREFRRASAAAIDASLKPLMTTYLDALDFRLREAGFEGRTLVVTSSGGVLDAADVSATPIKSIGSGPAAAPVAGRRFAAADVGTDTAIVTDAGGTSYDVSLVRRGDIPWSRETKLGQSKYGYITGFASVDIRSIGAAGGSIAWVDEGRILHVGPQSAGAVPGPVCYGQGGNRPTVTDAALVLGYLDAAFFLGGRIKLDEASAHEAIELQIARPLGMSKHQAAAAIFELVSEHMVSAIEEITLNQGIDPRDAVIVAGGGSGGFNAVAIARRLGVSTVVVPETAAGLSAMGTLFSDLTTDFEMTLPATTAAFRYEAVNAALAELGAKCRAFVVDAGSESIASDISFSAEARYPEQIWEIEVPLRQGSFSGAGDLEAFRNDFHRVHEEIFAIADPGSQVEVITWRARARCTIRQVDLGRATVRERTELERKREAYFKGSGLGPVSIRPLETMNVGDSIAGPAIVESAVTTIVIDPGATASRVASGSIVITIPS